MLSPGTRIGPYSVEAEIGVGATSVVYRVRHERLGAERALKVLSLSHPEVHRRILQEGRVQAELSHPNVVRVLEVIEVGKEPGLVLEYVDGPSLETWLVEHAEAPLPERDRVARQIVAGVAYAHQRGLVHRDLKPANVLMERGGVPRITDFGLAKILDAAPQVGDTRTGHALGTPRYMAPEQIRSAKHVDARADVFSLGCLLYELYCRRRAFPQEDMLSVFNAVTDGVLTDPAEVADLPEHVAAAIRAALEMEPADRPADASALLAMLQADEVHDFETTEVEDPPPAPPARRQPRWLAGVAAVGVGSVVGAAVGALALVAVAALVWYLK